MLRGVWKADGARGESESEVEEQLSGFEAQGNGEMEAHGVHAGSRHEQKLTI